MCMTLLHAHAAGISMHLCANAASELTVHLHARPSNGEPGSPPSPPARTLSEVHITNACLLTFMRFWTMCGDAGRARNVIASVSRIGFSIYIFHLTEYVFVLARTVTLDTTSSQKLLLTPPRYLKKKTTRARTQLLERNL